MKFFFLLFLSVASCSSLQTKKKLNQFNIARKSNIDGDIVGSQKLWEQLCLKKHKASCLFSGHKVSWHPELSIMQGSTDEKSSNIVLIKRKREVYQTFIFDPFEKKIIESSKSYESSRESSIWSIKNLQFKKLEKNKNYIFVVTSDNGELIDFRKFKTLDSKKKNLTWALTSCMADYYSDEQEKQWRDVGYFNPDVIFMIGDNVYIDWGKKQTVSPELIWQRHVETRNKLQVFRQKKLRPVFATWDDHDYGKNNGNINFRYKDESKKIFLEFFPMVQNKVVVSRGPGVSSAVEISGQLFLFMDDRYYRTPTQDKNTQSHFGVKQVQWALDLVKKSNGPVWLISGDQFFGGYHTFESFQGNHPKDFENFLMLLKKTKKRVLFLSGDRHLSEIMNIPEKYLGYKTVELTSSGIHSTTYSGAFKKSPNPLTTQYIDGEINYMIIKSQKKNHGVDFHVKDYGVDRKLIFEKKLSVK